MCNTQVLLLQAAILDAWTYAIFPDEDECTVNANPINSHIKLIPLILNSGHAWKAREYIRNEKEKCFIPSSIESPFVHIIFFSPVLLQEN
jgi:hypothetical protein